MPVHRLVQAVTADQMPSELAREGQQAAAALTEDAIPADTEPPATWPVCAALLPHAQAALTDDSDGMCTGWPGLPITSGGAAVTPPPGISSGE